MKRTFLLVLGLALLVRADVLAQNRADQQIFADLRMLQEQVQRLQLALNLLADQLKSTQQALAAQTTETRKGFADQAVAIGAVSSGLRTVSEAEKDTAIRVAQLNQELKAIRDGLSIQQTLLTQIQDLLQPKPLPAPPITDPAATGAGGAGGGVTPPPAGGGGLPPSPASYYNLAWSAYASNQFEDAIRIYEEALTRFPDAVEAPGARYNVGEAYLALNKPKEALEAYQSIVKLHPDADEVPNAHFKQGTCYEALNQRPDAEKSYQLVRTRYPESAAAPLATAALKRLGVIK
jgi:TolA-binding protein